jgi:hypothetical protein
MSVRRRTKRSGAIPIRNGAGLVEDDEVHGRCVQVDAAVICGGRLPGTRKAGW